MDMISTSAHKHVTMKVYGTFFNYTFMYNYIHFRTAITLASDADCIAFTQRAGYEYDTEQYFEKFIIYIP